MLAKYLTLIPAIIISATNARGQDSDNFLTILAEENPAYAYYDTTSRVIAGPATEIVRSLLQETGIQYDLSMIPWRRAYRRLQTEKNTCAYLVNKTPEREPFFQWVSPIMMGGWAVFKRHDSHIEITSSADLQKYNVVGKRDSAAASQMEKEAGINIMAALSDEAAVRLLYHGRADLWITGVNSGPLAAKKFGLPQPAIALFWKPAELSVICSKTTDKKLIETLNTANQTRLQRLKDTVASNGTPMTQKQH